MIDLLKAFGRGILYVVLFPFFLVALAIFAVIGLLAFIFQLFKSIIFFFTGQKFFPELPEDRELRYLLHPEQKEQEAQPKPKAQEKPKAKPTNLVYEEAYDEKDFEEEPKVSPIVNPAPQTVEQACFQEEVKPAPAPAPVQEPVKEELKSDPEADDSPLSDFVKVEPEMRDEENEILEVYKPRGNNDSYDVDDYEEDTDAGVNIRFDD